MQLGFLAGIVLQIIHKKTSSNSSKKDTKLMSERQIAELFISLFTSWISLHSFSVLFNQSIWHCKHFTGPNFPEGSTLWKSNNKQKYKM